MSIKTEDTLTSTVISRPQRPATPAKARWHELLFSPLWLCLLLALGLRIFLIVRTHGVLDGDEALVGIQAERILRGDFPVYFYGQAYMGSLEAYLIALLFAVFGSSVWTLRAEPMLLSLGVVWLTWRLAGMLTETTPFSPHVRRIFMTAAALCAAIIPLYDAIMEGRTYGGFIEMLVVILLLLISALRLTRRWFNGASRKELAWRWAGIGFLVGLGFWIYPLIISAVLAAGLWILGCCLLEVRRLKQTGASRDTWLQPVGELFFAVAGIPTGLLGMAPAIGWGATHNWVNIAYIVGLGGHTPLGKRITTTVRVTESYFTCVSPRIIGGAALSDTSTLLDVHQVLFVIGLLCIVVTLALLALGWLRPASSLAKFGRLAGLPTLFAFCTAFIFCVSPSSSSQLVGCGFDNAGRYATPILLALPFFFATTFTLIWALLQAKKEPAAAVGSQEKRVPRRPLMIASQVLLLLLSFGFLATHALTYALTNAGVVFQSNYCLQAPLDNGPVVNYLEQQHIRYIWGNNMIVYPLVFKSDLSVIGADADSVINPRLSKNRIPSYTDTLLQADRPSMVVVVPAGTTEPPILQALDAQHITYRTARFYDRPGFDMMVITPLNRTPTLLGTFTFRMFLCVSQK